MSEQPHLSKDELPLDAQSALRLVFTLETDEIAKALEAGRAKAESEEEKRLRAEVKQLSYVDSFDKRLRLLEIFATTYQIDGIPIQDKATHVFGTILNGIKSALEVSLRFGAYMEGGTLSAEMKKSLERNQITIQQGRQLVMRAIKFIGSRPWPGAYDEMMELWYTPSERMTGQVAWSGGGQLLASMLTEGYDQEVWDPFKLLGKQYHG